MVVRPLRQIQMAMSNKMEKFGDRWGERQEAAFKMLKAMLSNAPVLVSPQERGRFSLHPQRRERAHKKEAECESNKYRQDYISQID